jgi:glycosyltransferase involved in cell wall biosynthesis
LTGLRLRHLRLDYPSLSGARNLGIRHATGNIVGFPDDDCWYEPDAVSAVQNAFAADPELRGAIACWVEQSAAKGIALPQGALSLSAWRNYRGGDASSITLFMQKHLLQRLEGFDERFGVGCWHGAAEEIDLVLRALAGGARLVHCPAARVHHAFSTETPGPLRKACVAARKRARGTGGIYAKHGLGPWTVVRGLVAPSIVPLLRARWADAVRGCYISLGRLEGFIRWPHKNQ